MKTLSIVRHAKSSWDYPGLSDYDRPLNPRGKRNISEMGDFLQDKNLFFDLVLSSPANRAITTAIGLSSYLRYKERDIRLYKLLYHAVEGDILEVIQEQNDKYASLLMFGHNPGLTNFVNRYGDQYIDNVPTAAFVSLQFNISKWTEMTSSQGNLLHFYTPKGINN